MTQIRGETTKHTKHTKKDRMMQDKKMGGKNVLSSIFLSYIFLSLVHYKPSHRRTASFPFRVFRVFRGFIARAFARCFAGLAQKEKIRSVAKRNWLLRVPSSKGSWPCRLVVPV